MAEEPDRLVLELFPDIRSVQDQGGDRPAAVDRRYDAVNQRLEDIHETLYSSSRIAMTANAHRGVAAKELADVKRPLAKLEENA